MAAVDEGILHFPDQPVVISHHLSLSAMQICWALLLLLRTEGTSEPASKYKVDSERRKAGSFTLLVMIDFILYSCMLMNQLTLVFPQFSRLRSLCWTRSDFIAHKLYLLFCYAQHCFMTLLWCDCTTRNLHFDWVIFVEAELSLWLNRC